MKSDLDELIKGAGLDAIIVLGNSENNPPMHYFTGGGHISNAVLVKKPGQDPVLYCNAMERAEAAKSGLKVIPLQTGATEIMINQPTEILKENNLSKSRVGLYGMLDVGEILTMTHAIGENFPEIELIGEPPENSIFMRAMETKDESEVARIRKMGRITTEVVGMVASYLTQCEVSDDEVLLNDDRAPLTVADVKNKISLWLAERGAVDVEGTIFAIGREAGIPHSAGTPNDQMRLGQTIVFDIFPAEKGGGYFYDFTRTWSLGYATPEAQKLFDEVNDIYNKVVDNLDLNAEFKEYQNLVCNEFHSNGHNTPMHTKGVLENGYVHSLGHGLGLNVHERPWSRHTAPDGNVLRPGAVFTIEPGLYYPERGMGVRIEDSYWVSPDGKFELLAEYPYDFVLPMKKWKNQ
jgi:Xaa-Pro aminopeptidase